MRNPGRQPHPDSRLKNNAAMLEPEDKKEPHRIFLFSQIRCGYITSMSNGFLLSPLRTPLPIQFSVLPLTSRFLVSGFVLLFSSFLHISSGPFLLSSRNDACLHLEPFYSVIPVCSGIPFHIFRIFFRPIPEARCSGKSAVLFFDSLSFTRCFLSAYFEL